MPSGEAHGINRDYQVLAANIVRRLSGNGFFPYEGDGVDVQFRLGGTTWTLDVALKDSKGNIVVAECKRWDDDPLKDRRIEQEHIAAFAYKVHLLRMREEAHVAALFFAKCKYRLGAFKAAKGAGIEIITCTEQQSLDGFVLIFYEYNAKKIKLIKRGSLYAAASLKTSGDLTLEVIPASKSVPPKPTQLPKLNIKIEPIKLKLNPPTSRKPKG